MLYFHFVINIMFCYYNIGHFTNFLWNGFLHIANFHFIKALDCHRLHCWTFKDCQICTNFCLIVATCSKFQKPLKKTLAGKDTTKLEPTSKNVINITWILFLIFNWLIIMIGPYDFLLIPFDLFRAWVSVLWMLHKITN
jgi:hypothetical protein